MLARTPLVLVCLCAVDAAALANDVVRIGLLCGSTSAGAHCVQGAEQAAAEANADGGIDGRPVELVRTLPAQPWKDFAKQTADLMTVPGLVALVGPIDSVESHLAAQIATRNRIPIVGLSSDMALTRAFDPWIFRGAPADDQQALQLLKWSFTEPRGKTALAMLPDKREGRQRLAALEHACRSLGVELIAATAGELLPRQRADALLLWLDPEEAQSFLAAADPTLLPPIVTGPFWLDDPALLAIPSIFTGSIALPRLRSSPGPSPYHALAYDMVRLVIDAVGRAGLEPDRIREDLANTPLTTGKSGRFDFDERGDRREELRISTFKHDVPTAPAANPDSGGRQ